MYIYSSNAKLHIQLPLLWSLVSHDPSEIILILWFTAQETTVLLYISQFLSNFPTPKRFQTSRTFPTVTCTVIIICFLCRWPGSRAGRSLVRMEVSLGRLCWRLWMPFSLQPAPLTNRFASHCRTFTRLEVRGHPNWKGLNKKSTCFSFLVKVCDPQMTYSCLWYFKR